jgi:1-aminocyclopropane-1-carboxylate deaminase/D-cysteine desulfhydrase-like pyridoxal-dependent ACC family enzyme
MSPDLHRIVLGSWPTPVQPLQQLSSQRCSLWVKRDDASHPVYGGNKLRKLEYLLGEARARGASRIVTIGAAGSHHVLATTLHAREAGIPVVAILVPQPVTPHVIANLRAGIAAGLQPVVARSWAHVPHTVATTLQRGDFFVPPGGSNVLGSAGYVDAAAELAASVREGVLPEPDVIVVALGSGGTAAGLTVGALRHGLRATIVGVHVVDPAVSSSASARWLAWALARRLGLEASQSDLWKRLTTDASMLGAGYGHGTEAGARATERAAEAGLVLDPTYTAKAFAGALQLVEQGQHRTVLYVHTLSSAPLEQLLRDAPELGALPEPVQVLLRAGQPRGGA